MSHGPITRVRPSSQLGLLTGLMLLGGVTLALVTPHHSWRAPAQSADSESAPVSRVPVVRAVVAPAPSPAFAAEAAMTPGQLMQRWDPVVAAASHRFDVPAEWIRAVIRQESGGRTMATPYQPIISSAGAMGVMQVMPGTYAEMRQQFRLGADIYDPHDNIFAGTAYLKWLFGKYGYPAMFAAYNDGPGEMDDHLQNGRPLPGETRAYIKAIAGSLGEAGARLAEVKLTQPDGSPVMIDAGTVSAVQAALEGEYAPGVVAVISMGHKRQGVREDVPTVTALLRAHGAKV